MTELNCNIDVPITILAVLLLVPATLSAGKADIVEAQATCSANRVCSFSVTVRHNDTGWDHYADKWDVMTPGGEILGTRTLYHPHVSEQPFTRNLGNVKIPKDLVQVLIRAHDSKHGYGGSTHTVEIPD